MTTHLCRSAVALGASDYVLKGPAAKTSDCDDHGRRCRRIAVAGRGARRVASAMKVRQVIDDDEVPLTQLRARSCGTSPGPEQQEIGRSLEISVETVKEHVQNILRKIAVSDRTQAAVWAVRKGLV